MDWHMDKKRFWAIIAAAIMVLAILVSAIAPFAFGAEEMVADDVASRERPTRGKVLMIMEDTVADQGDGYSIRRQVADIEILEGPFEGQVIQVENYINVYDMVLSAKDEVLLFVVAGNNGRIQEAFVAEIGRDKYLIWIAIIFLAMVVLIGGVKGLKTIISLTLTVLAVIFILMPLVMKGYNPIAVSTIVCILITIITLLILNGLKPKTISAIIGTVSGILIAATLAWLFGSMAKLTGMGNEYAQLLAHMAFDYDFKGLLFAAIMLGSLGAVMDVSMSISSAMNEILVIDPMITQVDLFKSGMNIGRDLMGTMSNTLILAYAGGALHMILCFMADGVSFFEIINRDLIASEVVRAMSGSIGLISAIPITTAAVTLLKAKQRVKV
jgi:uncharacterized membrane protein